MSHEDHEAPDDSAYESHVGPAPWDDSVEFVKDLGKGAFGVARLFDVTACSGRVVVKEVQCQGIQSREARERLKREIFAMIKGISHPNVVAGYTFHPQDPREWCLPHNVQIMMQPAMGGEISDSFWAKVNAIAPYANVLHRWVSRSVKSKRRQIKSTLLSMMLVHTLRGLVAIHEAGFIHGDLKPANIWSTTPDATCLETLSCKFAIGDLGMLVDLRQNKTRAWKNTGIPGADLDLGSWVDTGIPCAEVLSGTPAMMPPEAAGAFRKEAEENFACVTYPSTSHTKGFNFEVCAIWTPQGDVWALGHALDKVIEKSIERTQQERIDAVSHKSYLPQGLRDVLDAMTLADFEMRPTAQQALDSAEKYFEEEYDVRLPIEPADIPNCLSGLVPSDEVMTSMMNSPLPSFEFDDIHEDSEEGFDEEIS